MKILLKLWTSETGCCVTEYTIFFSPAYFVPTIGTAEYTWAWGGVSRDDIEYKQENHV
jgi:hypothetical protein